MADSTTTELPRWRVLVIDDEPAIGRMIKNLLSKHDVDVVVSGDTGLARLREDGAYDVIVCDLMMPGLNGIELHGRIKTERPGLERRMVFVTGGAFTEASAAFLENIPNLTVQKPFKMADLEAAMAETVDAQGSR